MNEPFIYQTEPGMCDVDFMGRWQPGAAFRAMQEAGEGHCRALGTSFEELRPLGLAWVLTRARLQMDAYPFYGDAVTVRTWPGVTRHTFFPRYFTFEARGREVGRASMLYVLLDLETRKIALPARLSRALPAYDLPAPLPFPGNLSPMDAPARETPYSPVYTDFDRNGHVNNTRYVDWYMNLFSCETHRREELRDLLVHYHFEVMPGDRLLLETREQGSVRETRGLREGADCFALQGVWEERRG